MILDGAVYFYLKDEEHGWLSNFFPSGFRYNGRFWKTNEHFYQAQKANSPEFMEYIASAPNPYHAMLAVCFNCLRANPPMQTLITKGGIY